MQLHGFLFRTRYGDETSKYTIYIQNFSLQSLHSEDDKQQQGQEDTGLHQHLTGLVQRHSNIERSLKNLELLIQPLDQKLNAFDKEKQNFSEKYDIKNNDRASFDALLVRNRTRLRTPEDQQIIRDLRSEGMQLRASAVPLKLIRNLEAKTGSPKYEIQRDPQTTQDSLNSWDEVNLTSIRGVCADESVTTSTSSVS